MEDKDKNINLPESITKYLCDKYMIYINVDLQKEGNKQEMNWLKLYLDFVIKLLSI